MTHGKPPWPLWHGSVGGGRPRVLSIPSGGGPGRREGGEREMSYSKLMRMRAGHWVAAMVWHACCARRRHRLPRGSSAMAVGRHAIARTACRDTCQLPAAEIAAARTGGRRAGARRVALAVVTPGGDPSEGREIERALAAKVDGIVLEGEFPREPRPASPPKNSGTAVIELTSRSHLRLAPPRR